MGGVRGQTEWKPCRYAAIVNLTGPDRYNLTFNSERDNRCAVRCAKGTLRFSGLASQRIPKLYVVSRDNWPIHFGVTVQTMRTRLRFGFTAIGRGEYHGYAWRKPFKDAVLDVWCPIPPAGTLTKKDVETIEAEIVFLVRQSGQWPMHQTEIHFHKSNADHRRIAAEIIRHYEPPQHQLDGHIP